MSVDQTNWVNVGLMILAAAAAIVAPFHTFLIAYAVLGPLHYLTEISWLHDRQFFAERRTNRRVWLVVVAAATVAVTYGYVANDLLRHPVAPTVEIGFVYLAFAGGAIALYVRHPVNALMLVLLAAAGVALISGSALYGIAAYLLVTIIHVLLFTACFVVYGSMKSRSTSGFVSFGVFAACVLAAAFAPMSAVLPAGAGLRSLYGSFDQLNQILLRFIGRSGTDIYGTRAIGVMRVVAFAYTYHYFNWFSKTSIIRWHQVPRPRAVAIVALWIAGVGVYTWDYRLGFAVFYVLSLLHVMLEFPLDHQVIVGIFRVVSGQLSVVRPARRLTTDH